MKYVVTSRTIVRGGGDICFLNNESTVVELIAPSEGSDLYRSLSKRIGNAPYHICYIADNFERDLGCLAESGWLMIQPPQTAVAIDNRRVAFLYHGEIGMLELVEPVEKKEVAK